MTDLLFLKPVFQEKIWGGDALRSLYHYPIPSNKTGECWAISGHPNGVTTVTSGKYKGRGLDDLYKNEPQLFGNPTTPVFPLLTKILDANDWLSVQVHPDDHYAILHEGELGKTECWYILEAEEGAEIIYGHTATSKDELLAQIQNNQWQELLRKISVKKGDFYFVPSGTMHAIGKGIVILETQQSSDSTYRVYDFDRKDENGKKRDLHIQKSVDVLRLGIPENAITSSIKLDQMEASHLVSNTYFTVYKWKIQGRVSFRRSAPYLLVSVIDGLGSIQVNQTRHRLEKGQHFIIPHTIGEWTIEGDLEMIVSHTNHHQ